MELESLNGNIIGVVNSDYKNADLENKLVSDIILKKAAEALKMVKLDADVLNKSFSDLSIRDKNKVILASKLQDHVIILVNFSKGLLKKDIEYFKGLFKKIATYNRKIILIDNNAFLFLNCADKIYVIKNDKIVYETESLFDKNLEVYIDLPKIVDFVYKCENIGIRIDHYQEIDELLKAIYRIKS